MVIEVTKIANAASGKHCLAICSSDSFGDCSRFILNLSTTTKMSIRKNGALMICIYYIHIYRRRLIYIAAAQHLPSAPSEKTMNSDIALMKGKLFETSKQNIRLVM